MEARAVTAALAAASLSVPVYVVGIGAKRLPVGLSADAVSCVILAGLGGGLNPELRIGDVVLEDPQAFVASDIRRGRIHTSPHVVATSEEKADIFRRTGALAVEMEGDAARDVAKRLGIPFVGIRAISDTADEALDLRVARMIDDVGRMKPAAVALTLIANPAILRQLMRLNSNAKTAAQALGDAVVKVVRGLG